MFRYSFANHARIKTLSAYLRSVGLKAIMLLPLVAGAATSKTGRKRARWIGQYYLGCHLSGLPGNYLQAGYTHQLFKGISFQAQYISQDAVWREQIVDFGLGVRRTFFGKALIGLGGTLNLRPLSRISRVFGYELTIDCLSRYFQLSWVGRTQQTHGKTVPELSSGMFGRFHWAVAAAILPTVLSQKIWFQNTTISGDAPKNCAGPRLSASRFFFCPRLLKHYVNVGVNFDFSPCRLGGWYNHLTFNLHLSRHKPPTYAFKDVSQRDQARFYPFLTTCKRYLMRQMFLDSITSSGHASCAVEQATLQTLFLGIPSDVADLSAVEMLEACLKRSKEIAVQATERLAFLYTRGQGGAEKNFQKALHYYEKIGQYGGEIGADTYVLLGDLYSDGQFGVPPDREKASDYYLKAVACDATYENRIKYKKQLREKARLEQQTRQLSAPTRPNHFKHTKRKAGRHVKQPFGAHSH